MQPDDEPPVRLSRPELPAGAPSAVPPTFCRACGRPVDSRAVICPACGVAQHPADPVFTPGGGMVLPAQPKSSGVAIILSFLWPGAGHLYAADNDKAIAFLVISAICFLISLTIIGLVITIPVWLGCAIYTMIDSSHAADRYNQRLANPGR
ncbi:MAG: hypothetical protein JWL77_6938 [Chthonomonadaceae bacterium]|nr:hypothetical protein [Chthonomonadaceae bacterium]